MNPTVTLESLIKEFHLSSLFIPEKAGINGRNVIITTSEVNRPALPLAGYFKNFQASRIQIIGFSEYSYIETMEPRERYEKLSTLFSLGIPCLIYSSGLQPTPEIIQAAKDNEVPLLQTADKTSAFMAALIASLNVSLAPSITQHGVLVEVYGEGILILGDSGVGKSETAMELVKRGHRLVADDAVDIKRVSSKTLVGSAPPIIRHLIELRGVGLVDVRRIFGVGAVKETEKIDFIVKLELWDETKQYDRLGLEEEYHEILGIKCPCVTIPIKPGRNLAVIIEVAAINNRQRRLGYNAAADLDKRVKAGKFEPPSDDV